MNRQKMLLLCLILLFIAAVIYAYFRIPRQETAEKVKFKYTPIAPAGTGRKEPEKLDDKKLHLELLDSQLPRFSGFKRNIFWFPPLETRKKLPPPPPPPPPPHALPPPPPPPSPIRVEMARFTFLGFLKKDSKKTIFLAKDNEIFVVKKGDKLANNYEVTNIADDVITINALSGGGQIVIPLVENMPLIAR